MTVEEITNAVREALKKGTVDIIEDEPAAEGWSIKWESKCLNYTVNNYILIFERSFTFGSTLYHLDIKTSRLKKVDYRRCSYGRYIVLQTEDGETEILLKG